MSAISERFIKSANRMIEKFGRDVVIVSRINGTPPDPAKPHIPGPDSIDEATVRAVVGKEDFRDEHSFQRVDDGATPTENFKIIVGPLAYKPLIKDKVIIDGVEKTIRYVDQTEVNGVVVIYTIGLKA